MNARSIYVPKSLAKSKALEEFDHVCELLETLHDELHLAKFFFDEDHVNHGRTGVIGALGAVCEFIEAFDDFRAAQLTRPLRSIQTGLIDARNGTRNPVLKPAKFAGRPPSSQDKQRLRTYATVAMTLLMKSGRLKEQAASEVANALNQAGYKLDGRADIEVQPEEGIALSFSGKLPGPDVKLGAVKMDFSYADTFGGRTPEAYEALLLDCLLGDGTLFASSDWIEKSWELIMPILEAWGAPSADQVPAYDAGSWRLREHLSSHRRGPALTPDRTREIKDR